MVPGQEWKQDVVEVMLWMEEKGQMLVEEPSREPSNVRRKLRQHEAATRELAATQGHVEGLQQVRGAGPRVRGLLGFMFPLHSTFSWSTVAGGRMDLTLQSISIP